MLLTGNLFFTQINLRYLYTYYIGGKFIPKAYSKGFLLADILWKTLSVKILTV